MTESGSNIHAEMYASFCEYFSVLSVTIKIMWLSQELVERYAVFLFPELD